MTGDHLSTEDLLAVADHEHMAAAWSARHFPPPGGRLRLGPGQGFLRLALVFIAVGDAPRTPKQ